MRMVVMVVAVLSACGQPKHPRSVDDCRVGVAAATGFGSAVLAGMALVIAAAPCSETETEVCDAGHDPEQFLIAPALAGSALLGASALIAANSYASCTTRGKQAERPELDVAGALVLANSPKETVETLVHGAGLDPEIARGIVAHRDGADGLPRTVDDDRFDSLAELRAIAGMDDAVLDRLIQRGRALRYAR